MAGDLPTLTDGIVKRKACFHGNGNCCHHNVHIYVRNCGLYYVYKLKQLDVAWKARYCVEPDINGDYLIDNMHQFPLNITSL